MTAAANAAAQIAPKASSAAQLGAANPRHALLAGAAIVAIVCAAYVPVLRAGFIWDDHENIHTNATLQSSDGLWNIWFVPRSTQQYYPLMYTSYWLEYQLWGLNPRGYHVVNVLLHAAAAVLVWRLLRRLRVPGAWLAAAIFAVHPVEVESVAWITERKNVLSLVLALLSLLAYLRFHPWPDTDACETGRPKRWPWYALSLATFALALSAKTVVVTLPPVILVLCWWKRGRITPRDLIAVVPFFALAIALGLVTIWMETHYLRAQGKAWELTPPERLLLAGRALWFYAGKLLWPHPLAFFYPRWQIDERAGWQYLLPLAALAAPAALLIARQRLGRGPLAAVLIFAGVMVPMLGFFNIFYTLYAQVSDHFQYHASVALIAVCTAGGAIAARRFTLPLRLTATAAAGALLAVLAVLTFRQIAIYHDLETLYRDTIAKNPQGVIAYSNLAVELNNLGRYDEAIELARQSVALGPRDPMARANLGYYLLNRANRRGFAAGELEEAIANLEQAAQLSPDASGDVPDPAKVYNYLGALRLEMAKRDRQHPEILNAALADLTTALQYSPGYIEARVNLGNAALTAGLIQPASEAFAQVLRDEPDNAEALYGMAMIRSQSGDPGGAEPLLRRAVEINPQHLAARYTLAMLLLDQKRADEATVHLEAIVAADPRSVEARFALAGALVAQGKLEPAAQHYRQVISLRRDNDRAWNNLGVVQMNLGRTADAVSSFAEAVRLNPDYAEARGNLSRAQEAAANESRTK